MSVRDDEVGVYTRVSIGIIASTLILTSSFLGVLAIASREIEGFQSRIPWYLLLAALVFVATIVILENYGADGREILLTSLVSGVTGLTVGLLSVEGIIYTIRFPSDVFISRLVIYFVAAGLIGTGIAYWALRHWREFTDRQSRPRGRL